MSKHPIPGWLRSQFSRIEDEVQKLGPCGVFTQMRTVTQTYFEQQAEAAQPPALGGDLEVLGVAAYVNQCNGQFVLKRELDTDNFPEFWDKLVFLKDASALFAPLQAEIKRQDQELDDRAQWDTAQIKVIHGLNDDVAKLKARRDELEGLLRIVRGKLSFGPDDVISIDAALSKTAGSEQ
ncbi:hypothetical protein QIT82_gp23 [Pseudomonas phage psageK9]|uniref:Uncharacterized protein n=1 Tax=Pseudomonas phage psageK9 TaxID=2875722 RepID=A0AAE8XNC0_9CAUD|nr:hypothetical protein [Pseudomonas syringae]YP_010773229.1 hypothetical protein QIT82_gp23 [Pseudomonas phage psageK9]QXV71603.1 putative nucleotide pyrophosphohydrolase [Pseudomonas phage psageB2]MDG6423770.1 hypothetical protein [Pseudomonas syringae pv. actinidiae]MDG6439151.1 hypothetical protein [Pseudomonas syringae pv. actinidiae]UAW53893.1 hypothetical protein psageK9_23c [Pseudomonas phage psageK9]